MSKSKVEAVLFCYACAHSVASMDFPSAPSGERPCCFCIRNPKRGYEVKVWYDGTEPIRIPMDCYHSLDMLEQIERWMKGKKKQIKEEKRGFG